MRTRVGYLMNLSSSPNALCDYTNLSSCGSRVDLHLYSNYVNITQTHRNKHTETHTMSLAQTRTHTSRTTAQSHTETPTHMSYTSGSQPFQTRGPLRQRFQTRRPPVHHLTSFRETFLN